MTAYLIPVFRKVSLMIPSLILIDISLFIVVRLTVCGFVVVWWSHREDRGEGGEAFSELLVSDG